MKTKFLLLVSLFAVSIVFDACKKGEDDPLISFHSRKARIAGDWEVVSYKYTDTYNSSGSNSTTTYTMNGSTYTEVNTDATGITTKNGTEIWEWTFEKDGTYDFTHTQDGKPETSKGTWNFTSGVGDLKNKSQITYWEQNYTYSGGSGSYTGNYVDAVFDIIELRNKKMMWYYKYTGTSSTSNSSYEVEIEFEAK